MGSRPLERVLGLVQFPNDFIGWLLDRQCNRDGGRALNYGGDALYADVALASMRTPILSLGATSKQLSEIAKAHPAVAIGSSPSFDPQHGLNTNVVLRVCDAQKLTQAKHEIEGMLERVRRAQSSS